KPRVRRRHAAPRAGGARDDGASRERARERVLGRAPLDAGRADRAVERTRPSDRPEPPLGRRERGPRAGGRPPPGAHRRRPAPPARVRIAEGAATVAGDNPGSDGRGGLERAGLAPIARGPKEGLALINGTRATAAAAALAVIGAERLARAADIAAALSIDGLR